MYDNENETCFFKLLWLLCCEDWSFVKLSIVVLKDESLLFSELFLKCLTFKTRTLMPTSQASRRNNDNKIKLTENSPHAANTLGCVSAPLAQQWAMRHCWPSFTAAKKAPAMFCLQVQSQKTLHIPNTVPQAQRAEHTVAMCYRSQIQERPTRFLSIIKKVVKDEAKAVQREEMPLCQTREQYDWFALWRQTKDASEVRLLFQSRWGWGMVLCPILNLPVLQNTNKQIQNADNGDSY